jgi:hypothetical protein
VGGEAPVTPVSTLDSSFLTFPTNRAITIPTSLYKSGSLNKLTYTTHASQGECSSFNTDSYNIKEGSYSMDLLGRTYSFGH